MVGLRACTGFHAQNPMPISALRKLRIVTPELLQGWSGALSELDAEQGSWRLSCPCAIHSQSTWSCSDFGHVCGVWAGPQEWCPVSPIY